MQTVLTFKAQGNPSHDALEKKPFEHREKSTTTTGHPNQFLSKPESRTRRLNQDKKSLFGRWRVLCDRLCTFWHSVFCEFTGEN